LLSMVLTSFSGKIPRLGGRKNCVHIQAFTSLLVSWPDC
jgi:hypothetical protein